MRCSQFFVWICTYFTLCACIAEAKPTALTRRQENTPTTTSASTDTAIKSNASPTSDVPSTARSKSTSDSSSVSGVGSGTSSPGVGDSTTTPSTSPDSTPTRTDGKPSITSAINGPLQTSSNSTADTGDASPDELPLAPKSTPALAVAGVFLILTGFTYTLIGIKNKWVQIFLSSAFLTSLSVTVLLVYVMHPPVRPAVQGAYFVAAFMTGMIFGVGALVFKEVTEGLGCLLGGFCSSMWLLALTPGGTLQSTGGKVILIAAFTVAAYGLSFSHYTRPYGLIGATSFGGATAAVLGFDCFSRAGLKEFWLYIWNLNDNLFPLNTNTYPITRGIRVELAVIVLICFLGVISQLKLWKVIKDRREKKDAIRVGDERERDQMEEAIGRRLEEGNERERAQWEAAYGDQGESKRNTNTDSGLGTEENNSLRKTSVSVREVGGMDTPTEVIEMKAVEPQNTEVLSGDSGETTQTTQTMEESVLEASQKFDDNTKASAGKDKKEDRKGKDRATADEVPMSGIAVGSSSTPHQPAHAIVPLPFTVQSLEQPDRLGAESVLTFAESEPEIPVNSDGVTRANTIRETEGHTLSHHFLRDTSSLLEGAMHSRGSSVAATIDDDLDQVISEELEQNTLYSRDDESSPKAEDLPETKVEAGAESPHGIEHLTGEQVASDAPTVPALPTVEDDPDPEEFQRPILAVSAPQAPKAASSSHDDNEGVDRITRSSRSRPSAPVSEAEGSQVQDFVPRSRKRVSLGAVSSTGSLTKGALERVPSQVSHVVMSYRTNEWAKHIATANEPEFDEPEPVPEGTEEELPTRLAEVASPVREDQLQKNATTAQRPSMLVSQQPSPDIINPNTDLNRTFSGKSNNSSSHLPSGRGSWDSTTQPDILQVLNSQLRQGNSSAIDLSRSSSVTSQPGLVATRGLRSSSTPALGQILMTPPIDENAEVAFPPPVRPSVSPLPNASATLMAQRDSFLRNKHAQFAARNTPSPSDMMYSQPPLRSNSRLSMIEEAVPRSASRLSYFDDREAASPMRSASRLSLPIANEDDIPLSQRKAIIQQQPVTFLPETRLSATNDFDAHLPQRASSAAMAQKRESMLASWRESMRQELALNAVPKDTVESRRAEMLMEKQQSKMHQQHSEVTKVYQENAFDQAMRRRDLQELHKEAMRKMQANASKHVS
jgi:Domain of unknown function (DUF4203)